MKQLIITSEKAARVLTDSGAVRRLEPFMKRDTTLSEAAQELNLKLPSLLYHVDKFIELGLLEVVREIARKGRAVKVYRSTAHTFFVPYHLTPSETLAQLLGNLISSSERRFHREAARTLQTLDPDWGLNISCPSDEGISYVLAPRATNFLPRLIENVLKPDAPALFLSDGTLELDFGTAKALQKDLVDLFETYRQKQDVGNQGYAYRLGLTPLHEDTFEP